MIFREVFFEKLSNINGYIVNFTLLFTGHKIEEENYLTKGIEVPLEISLELFKFYTFFGFFNIKN